LSSAEFDEILPGVGTYHDVGGDHPHLEEFACGEWVLYAQKLLQKEGFEPQDKKIDGLFGPYTAAAVSAFQDNRNLDATGKIDKETWEVLEGKRIVVPPIYLGPHLAFEQSPYVDGRGWLTWTVKNIGSEPVPAYTSGGNYEMTHGGTTIPGGGSYLRDALAPDAVAPYFTADLNGHPDGDYQASVQLGSDFEYVNYRVVGGKAQPY
jgi:hypothetical protein